MTYIKIADHLGLSFRTAAQLNKMIDEKLPGRPPFMRSEVVVGGEVCEVYFRDIVKCIRSLFGDPKFAPYLTLAPEKHYTQGSDGKHARMYHDLHTGKWWWATQVRLNSSVFIFSAAA